MRFARLLFVFVLSAMLFVACTVVAAPKPRAAALARRGGSSSSSSGGHGSWRLGRRSRRIDQLTKKKNIYRTHYVSVPRYIVINKKVKIPYPVPVPVAVHDSSSSGSGGLRH